jgi:O-antigen ligase
MRDRIANNLLLAAVFILPWQTQVIFDRALVGGEPSQYGVFALFVTEALIIAATILRGRPQVLVETTRVHQALYYFLAIAFFSLGFSSVDQVGWFLLLHAMAAGGLFIMITDQRTNIQKLVSSFLLGLIVPVSVAWGQVIQGSSPDSTMLGMAAKDAKTAGVAVVESDVGRTLRGYGTFPHPNIFGGYLAVGIVALAWLARFVKTRRDLFLLLTGAALLGSTLIVTFSRSGWFGLLAGSLVLVGLMYWHKRIPPSRAIPILSIGIASVLLSIVVFWPQVMARFTPTIAVEAISIEERVGQYSAWDDVFLSAPFIGVGPAAYTFTLLKQDPGHEVWAYQPIHNVPLLVLAELGVIGFFFFVVWIVRMDVIAHRAWKTPGGMLALSLGTTLLVIALFDHYLWTLWPGLALGALSFGCILRWSKE